MKHFSSYLLDEELVTVNQLENCIAAQTVNNQIIGNYAVRKGFISDGVLKHILIQKQEAIKNKTNDLCNIDGYISNNQMFELLKYQAFNHNYLGVSLVNLGYMTVSSLKTHLRRFKKMIIETNDYNEFGDSGQHGTKLLQKEVINRHRSYLFNTGYATELVSVSTDCIQDKTRLNFSTSLKLNRKVTYYVGISLEKDTLFNIAALKGEEYKICPGVGELYEIFGQILFNLNYSVCRNLKKNGLKLKHGAVQYYFLPCQDCITTRFNLLNEYIDISIMRFPLASNIGETHS